MKKKKVLRYNQNISYILSELTEEKKNIRKKKKTLLYKLIYI